MQTFIRVAEAGSFTSVANHLGVDRSQITRQIAALEKYLATKLIIRSTRNLSLTTAGIQYLEQCRNIINLIDNVESNLIEEKKSLSRGRIRIGMPLIYGQQILMEKILDFAIAQPLIELELELSDEKSNLINEGLDLSIRITTNLEANEIVRKLGTCRLLTVASPKYLNKYGNPSTPNELQHHKCLLYSNSTNSKIWSFDKGKINIPVQGQIISNNGLTLVYAAIKGLGIIQTPDFIAMEYVKRGEIVEILSDYSNISLGIYVVLPSNRYIPQRVSMLIDYLAEQIQTN